MSVIKGFAIAAANSGFDRTGKSFEQIVDICLKSGFEGLEGGPNLFEKVPFKELERIRKLFRDAGLVIETYHLPYKDPLLNDIATLYETDRRKVENNLKKHIDIAVALGASVGVIHPTSKKDCLTEDEGLDRFLGQAGKTIQGTLRHSEQYGFKIAVENMLPYLGDRLGSKIIHLEMILKRNDHPLLGFCLDTGHALVSHHEKAMDVFHFMKDRLIAFHLADNSGDRDSHLAPGHGRFFWKEFAEEFKKINYSGFMCVETPPFSYGPDYSVEAWKKMHDEVSVIMHQA